MRCKACNSLLNEFEATRKGKESGEFVDLCNTCYTHVMDDVQAVENYDFLNYQDSIDIEE